ncbi:O-antigen ligase family protein [Roseiconus lacunae]|uniref:O-antigen ligase family protein n=1 Tax=Roseiconus lacunae TaxID=2605694 RepID=UPI0011F0EE6F|nr:O-antigen ligase family protein [Roseiconus lacunae]
MTPGIVLLLLIWAAIVATAFRRPWIGVVGYAGFAVLCPTWNWRWGLPDLDYQKFLAGATLIGWLLAGLRRQPLERNGTRSLIAIGAYSILTFASLMQSINPEKSSVFWDISWKIVLMAMVATFLLDTPRKVATLVWVLVLCQGWNAFNINQLYLIRGGINTNYFRWNYLDNNTYSISTIPIMALSFALLVNSTKKWQVALAGFILVMQMHQLMFLNSRGTMLGGILLGVLGVLYMTKSRRAISIVFAGTLAAVVLAGPSVVKEFMSTFESSENRDSSAESRFYIWKAGAKIMAAYPALGVGPWAGEVMVPQYYDGPLKPGTKRKALHNLFFEVGTGSGIPAVLFYLGFFWLPWFQHWRLRRQVSREFPDWMNVANLATLCGIPGYWLSSMFSSGALIEAPYLLVTISIGSLAVYSSRASASVAVMRPAAAMETSSVPLIPVGAKSSEVN